MMTRALLSVGRVTTTVITRVQVSFESLFYTSVNFTNDTSRFSKFVRSQNTQHATLFAAIVLSMPHFKNCTNVFSSFDSPNNCFTAFSSRHGRRF
jgi:hypothetical protein